MDQMDERDGLVLALPHLVVNLGTGAQVVQCVVGKETDQMLVQSLAEPCKDGHHQVGDEE